jgi:hypothetical protein
MEGDEIQKLVAEAIAASDTVVSDPLASTRTIIDTVSSSDRVINTLNYTLVESVSAAESVTAWRIVTTVESASASDNVMQPISISVLVTETASLSTSVFLGVHSVSEEAAASSTVMHWAVVRPPVITETAAATDLAITANEGAAIITESASATATAWDILTASNLVLENAVASDDAVQSWSGVTVWSADTASFGMTTWDQYPAFDIQAALGKWYGIVDGNIVQLVEEPTPQTDLITPTSELIEYTAAASQIDATMTGTMVFGLAENSGVSDWQYAECEVTAITADQNTQCGLVLRMTATASDAFEAFVLLLQEDGSLSIQHVDVYGGDQTVDSMGELMASSAGAYEVGDVVRFSVSGYGKGTDLTAWINGVAVMELDIGNAVEADFMLTGKQGFMFLDGAAAVAISLEAGTLLDPSKFVSGLTDFGDDKLKHLTCFRSAYRSADPLLVSIGNTGSGKEVSYQYSMIARTADDMVPGKAKLGKGARSRHWRVSVETSGKPFVMREAMLEIDTTSRKI